MPFKHTTRERNPPDPPKVNPWNLILKSKNYFLQDARLMIVIASEILMDFALISLSLRMFWSVD